MDNFNQPIRKTVHLKHLQTYNDKMQRIGILVDATDIERRRRINSDNELTFKVPMDSFDFTEKIQIKGFVSDELEQFYVINEIHRIREGKKLFAQIIATHVMFMLSDYKMPYSSYIEEAYGIPVTRLTDAITQATGGQFRFVVRDTFDLCDVKDWGRGNCLNALNQLVKKYGCEIEPDNFTLHLRKKIGADSGLQYRFKKNIIGMKYKEDTSYLITRLFSQMKDGRTFIGLPASHLTAEERTLLSEVQGAIVNGKLAVNYLISPHYAKWSTDVGGAYLDGEVIEQDIEDPLKLLEATRKHLRDREVPLFEVVVTAADLFKIDALEPKPNLGDTVHCLDSELGLNNVSARIIALTEYPYTKEKHAQVTLANVMMQDYDDLIVELERHRREFVKLFSGGKIRTEVFERTAKDAVKDVHASKTEVTYDSRGIILKDKRDNRNQVALTSNGIVVSTDGLENARSAVNARGVVAEAVVGQLGDFVSMQIGAGDRVTKINTNGISAGDDNWADAPFRVDMHGNLTANSLRANSARISNSNFSDGDIVGSTINVGDGKFTVDKDGNMEARDGKFRGDINASTIDGGTITGTTIRTARYGRRIELDAQGLRTYDSGGDNRLDIDTGSDKGMATMGFRGPNGRSVGVITSVDYTHLGIIGDNVMIQAFNKLTMNGFVQFSGDIVVNGNIRGGNLGLGELRSEITSLRRENSSLRYQLDGLKSEISSLWNRMSQKSDKGHTHQFTTPPHNHGNRRNEHSGGYNGTTTRDYPW